MTAATKLAQLQSASLEDANEPRYLHAVLAQVGMPRAPTKARYFTRTNGNVALSLQAGVWFNGRETVEMPLPSGVKPRLILLHCCSEAVRAQSRTVDLGRSVRNFLMKLGIDTGGHELARFKREMLALASSHLSLTMIDDETGQVKTRKCDPIESFDAWLVNDGNQTSFWPGELELSERFYETLIKHAVPLDNEAIAKLKDTALGLDAYAWLAHRLCRIRNDQGARISWLGLKEQFGQEYNDLKNFKQTFLIALRRVHAAYPEARIDQVRGGLLLKPSPPPIARRQVVVALPTAPALQPAPKASEIPAKTLPKPAIEAPRFITENALNQVRTLAPNWDRQFLLARYKEWTAGKPTPDNPDAAFLGWVRKFTKGKPPQ